MKTLVITSLDELHARIREERIKQELTQHKLAILAKVKPRTVSNAECGQHNTHVEVLLDIVRALGYDSIEFKLK